MTVAAARSDRAHMAARTAATSGRVTASPSCSTMSSPVHSRDGCTTDPSQRWARPGHGTITWIPSSKPFRPCQARQVDPSSAAWLPASHTETRHLARNRSGIRCTAIAWSP